MRKRKSSFSGPQYSTLNRWMKVNRMTPKKFLMWLERYGITITDKYLDEMIRLNDPPGPKFAQVFRQLTGITLYAE